VTGSYDCVDRIVLNAFFPLGHNPGGFRTWWRRWQGEPRCPQRHWELALALGGLLLGVVDHPLAEVDEGILLSCGHGVGQLAQLDGEPV
jgi:hypothetical protein